ncbi:MAG: Trm112 family protein [Candidatus Omnitrophica bacterium]|nr:Trm112 family protein [Candidatus Omnitrophota bacterium]
MDRELLKILACPACQGDVELKENKVICNKCERKYPIREGIPIMLIEEAEEK